MERDASLLRAAVVVLGEEAEAKSAVRRLVVCSCVETLDLVSDGFVGDFLVGPATLFGDDDVVGEAVDWVGGLVELVVVFDWDYSGDCHCGRGCHRCWDWVRHGSMV